LAVVDLTESVLRVTRPILCWKSRPNMCILFMYVNNNPSPDGYQLVIANNRDEFYDRPAQPAAFWEKHPYCIGGKCAFRLLSYLCCK